jgi:hypothetical protein
MQAQIYTNAYLDLLDEFVINANILHQKKEISDHEDHEDQKCEFPLRYKSEMLVDQLIINRVKDILQFYTILFRHLLKMITETRLEVYKCPISPKEQKVLIHYLSFLETMMTESAFQISIQRRDLIEMFIFEEVGKMHRKIQATSDHMEGNPESQQDGGAVETPIDVDKMSWNIIGAMLDDMVVEDPHPPKRVIKLNSFIKMLLNKIK